MSGDAKKRATDLKLYKKPTNDGWGDIATYAKRVNFAYDEKRTDWESKDTKSKIAKLMLNCLCKSSRMRKKESGKCKLYRISKNN